MGIHAFPKIFTIGQDYISDLFKDDVEVTEKVDGSQWVFGKVGGDLLRRSTSGAPEWYKAKLAERAFGYDGHKGA